MKEFHNQLKKYEGSLVKVSSIKGLNAHAKEYLIKLAKLEKVEKVTWGWYYITPKTQPENTLEFLAEDKNFKVVVSQSAASIWNQDFIHRNTVTIAVNSLSYKRALEAFAKKHGWYISVEYDKISVEIKHRKIGNLLVEDREQTIIDCMKKWAFVDAIATLSASRNLSFRQLIKDSFWVRVFGTNIRVKQAIEYATYKLKVSGRRVNIKNEFVQRELDEAIAKVSEFE